VAEERDDNLLNPEDIEALLNSAGAGPPAGNQDVPGEPQAEVEDTPLDETTSESSPPDGPFDPNEIEALLAQHQTQQPDETSEPNAAGELLDQAESNLAAAIAPDLAPAASLGNDLGAIESFKFDSFDSRSSGEGGALGLEALHDVELDLRIELGRTELLIEEILELKEGSVVPLDKLAGDPVDILVNGRLIARGEVLVLNDNFCVRVAEFLTPEL